MLAYMEPTLQTWASVAKGLNSLTIGLTHLPHLGANPYAVVVNLAMVSVP